jgi:hypothetical protein
MKTSHRFARRRPVQVTFAYFVVAMLACLTGVTHAAQTEEDAGALLASLDTMPCDLEVVGVRLDEVLETLSAELPVQITADWSALDSIFVERDDEVSVRMPRSNAAAVLDGIVRQLGDEFDRPVVESYAGQLVLTSRLGAVRYATTVVYDVRDLLRNNTLNRLRENNRAKSNDDANDVDDDDDVDEDIELSQGESKGGDPVRNVNTPADHASSPGADDVGPAHDMQDITDHDTDTGAVLLHIELTPGEQLMELIAYHVDPDAWDAYGGSRAKITERNGLVFVTAAPSIHLQFSRALAQLRLAHPTQMHLSVTVVEVPRTLLIRPVYQRLRTDSARRTYVLHADETTILWNGSVLQAFDIPTTLQTGEDGFTINVTTTCTRSTDDEICIAFDVHIVNVGFVSDVRTTLVHRGPTTNSFVLAEVETRPSPGSNSVRQVLVATKPM